MVVEATKIVSRKVLQMVTAGDTNAGHGLKQIEHHLEFYNANGEQLEHYGSMPNAFIPPRKGEHVILGTRIWR